MADSRKVWFYLLQTIVLLLFIVYPSQGESANIVKSLPGYPGDLPFTLETGYVGVGESEEIQLFYYFVESERDVEKDPLLLWLTGGPGCSSLSGLLYENGPMTFRVTGTNVQSDDIPQLQINPNSWTKVSSLIYLDTPVGTGFSYATTLEAYSSSDTLQAKHIYDFLRKWLIGHPKFIHIPLYIGGDSYVGRVLPVVVQNVLNGNKMGMRPKLNIKGYVLGNPLTTKSNKARTTTERQYEYYHRVSLLSDELYESAMVSCNGDFLNDDAQSTECKRNIETIGRDIRLINSEHVLEHQCGKVSSRLTKTISQHKDDPLDHLNKLFVGHSISEEPCLARLFFVAYTWANYADVREALHVREGTIGHWVRCTRSLIYEYNVQDSSIYHKNLTSESLEVLIYSGDQDSAITYLNTLGWINELGFQNDHVSNPWQPWYVDGQVAGYITTYLKRPYRLTFTTIKGAGHIALQYKPRECRSLIENFLALGPSE